MELNRSHGTEGLFTCIDPIFMMIYVYRKIYQLYRILSQVVFQEIPERNVSI